MAEQAESSARAMAEQAESSARALAQASMVEAARVEQMRDTGVNALATMKQNRDAHLDALVA
eukprot:2632568-Prymnesium_polylepis.1